jgi:hypothetical protein
MGGQPGKPKPLGNPPIRLEPRKPQPIEEPPRPIPVPPAERPPLPITADLASYSRNHEAGQGQMLEPDLMSLVSIALWQSLRDLRYGISYCVL